MTTNAEITLRARRARWHASDIDVAFGERATYLDEVVGPDLESVAAALREGGIDAVVTHPTGDFSEGNRAYELVVEYPEGRSTRLFFSTSRGNDGYTVGVSEVGKMVEEPQVLTDVNASTVRGQVDLFLREALQEAFQS